MATVFDPAFNYGQLPSLTGFALRRASLWDFAGFGDAVGDRSITPQRYSLLEIVSANPGLQQIQLADILGLSKAAASLTIDFWQKRGYLERRKGEQDRRSFGIYLTKSGKTALARLQERVQQHDTELTKSLSKDELRQLRTLLEKVYRH